MKKKAKGTRKASPSKETPMPQQQMADDGSQQRGESFADINPETVQSFANINPADEQ